MDPEETITATPGAPVLEPVEVAVCAGCDSAIFSGEGVTVDKNAGRWHPECRVADLRKTAPKKAGRAAG
jgi:hypothetical protein